MKSLLLASFTFSFALTLAANAANNKVGNGGDVVSCSASSPTLLDFYEGGVSPANSGKSSYEQAAAVIAKLKTIAPKLHEHYSSRLAKIENEIEFKNNVELTDLDDSKHLFKPLAKDCSIVQIAIRRAEVSGDEKRFLFRKDLWEQLPQSHQAGLLVHEIAYEHLYRLGEQDSVKVRKLNRLLFTDDLNSQKFWQAVKQLKIPIYP